MRHTAIAMILAFLLLGGSVVASAQQVESSVLEQQSSSVLERRCEAGDLDACIEVGKRLRHGILGLRKDTVRAVSLLEQACDAGKPDGCYNLGEHFTSSGDAATRARAVQLFQKACDGAHGDGCASLGVMYRTGMTIGRDYARASSLFEQACNLRSLHGCWAGEVFHHPTHGDLKDATRWAAHKERLCDPHGNAESCVELGLVYDLGTWLPKNADRANDLFRKSCLYGLRTGVKEGCALIRK